MNEKEKIKRDPETLYREGCASVTQLSLELISGAVEAARLLRSLPGNYGMIRQMYKDTTGREMAILGNGEPSSEIEANLWAVEFHPKGIKGFNFHVQQLDKTLEGNIRAVFGEQPYEWILLGVFNSQSEAMDSCDVFEKKFKARAVTEAKVKSALK